MADQDRFEIEFAVEEFAETLRASFIGSEKSADERYAPRLVVNDKATSTNVLAMIRSELVDCISFDFSVAFITSSGIQTLVEIFNTLQLLGIHGRILTSTYLDFNDPEALRKLLEFPNIETRIYQGDLHAKGYFFNRDGLSTFIIGSSNLTQTALTCNKEWNVLFRSFSGGEMLRSVRSEYEKLWDDPNTIELSSSWIDGYEKHLASYRDAGAPRKALRTYVEGIRDTANDASSTSITPNAMQEHALEALDVLQERHESRALLVSATGTGKTYLAALEIERRKPKRVLYVAHRERILKASMASFKRVLGAAYTYGLYGSGHTRTDASCVFAMVSTLAKHLDDFEPNDFDYIIIDEAHRCGAEGYLHLLDHFEPTFYLGMTATPSRTDHFDVYRLFNNVIAYRITLQDALDNDMLAPFHYFGIADLFIDEEKVDDVELFRRLTSNERVRHVVEKIERYTVDKKNRRGLIFCSKVDEAEELSKRFNELGYRTAALSGRDSQDERDAVIEKLEAGELEYIFSVDIFNEGVDIPSLNQIIMLRKTQSAVVFVQQLGRGLRKSEGKEFTLVLDFIGNYQENYLIPIALSGDQSYNKDTLRRVVKEGSTVIPGSSTISFDRISEQRIFRALEATNFSLIRLLKDEYRLLKQQIGRIPRLIDFDHNDAIDPLNIIDKCGSYAAFLLKYEDECTASLSKRKLKMLAYLSKIASGKRGSDLAILKRLLAGKRPLAIDDMAFGNRLLAADEVGAALRYLSGTYYPAEGISLVSVSGGTCTVSDEFAEALKDPFVLEQVNEIIEFGLERYGTKFEASYKDTNFVLYEKYDRDEICRLLRWSKQPNQQNVGGYFHDKATNTFPVFINYEKDPSISVTTQYEDRFESENRLIAISKSNRSLRSPEIQTLKGAATNGVACYLFMRKNKNDKNQSKEFYFLGQVHPTGEFEEIVMADGRTKAVEIVYDLEEPVRPDIYDYLTSSFDEE